MNASLFTACKAADCFRPIQVVYRELSRICQSAPSAKIRSIMGDRDTQSTEIDQRDFLQITQAELDLLKSIDFDFDIDTPFTHFNRWKQTLIDVVPDEAIMQLCNSIIIDICLMICSAFYLDVPPEVAAAAATEDSLKTQIIPAETLEWLNSVKAKYGQEVFTLAIESIACEKRKTATIPRQPQRKPPLK
ncbi:Cyclin, N-terminal domain containing protein [Histomonas meleagridis]|uniref:Cyclin, N-terminal domain containing protein n=1 Tax=Histomonas meleagridis TaxID=135588 RepID=UPI00355AA048|nr:Cyclin, N-terminal domain containing protein [Histomonas meleagridis]KAH0807066.1 Cyclin, N-terminal domain containing protein [Histomonas meleagridis]